MMASRVSAIGVGDSASAQRSGLVVDVDFQTARAILFSRVDGQVRFVSGSSTASTAMPQILDVTVGVRQAIRAIEEHLGTQILGVDGVEVPQSGEHGVDLFAITGAPVAPTRLSLLTLGNSSLTAPLLAASRRTATVSDVITDRVRTADGIFSGALLENAIRDFAPDVLVIIEGESPGNQLQTTIGTLSSLVSDGAVSLVIIVAGDQTQQHAAQVLGDAVDLRGIDPAEFSPLDIAAALEAELQSLYDQRVDTDAIVASTDPPRFVSRMRAADLVTRFLARRMDETVVSVDSGDGTMMHWASPTMSDVVVRQDIDVSRNIRSILNADLSGVAQWLPFTMSIEDLSHWVLNRALRPNSIAETAHDMAIERAVLVELLRSVWKTLSASRDSRVDLIVAGRPFSCMPSKGLAAMSLLDIFQPNPENGIVEMVVDSDGLVPAAGAIGERNPAMAADVIESDLLLRFATAVIVDGSGTDGELAIRGQVRYVDGDVSRFSVPFGSVHLLKLNPWQPATITLVCEGTFTVGGQREVPDMVVGGDENVAAGDLGLIIDARGRPLKVASDPSSRATRVANWLEDLGLKV
jgi:hypothetical protein